MARIKLDLDRTIGGVDRRIFGGFVEHLGRCIYGGVFEPGSPLADERGFRRDVVEAVRPLGVPVLRWPGGNFASGYHWTDGIGPLEARPRRMELAWHAEESNRFGTDEFLAYCHVLGAEPYICLNLGTGTLDEAQAWVEYCNGTGDTYCDEVTHTDPPAPDPWPHRVADLGPFKLLDVAATRDPDARRLVLAVVNRAPETPVHATVSLGGAVASGQVTAWRVDGPDVTASNDFDRPDAVGVTQRRRTTKADQLEEDFPPHSITLLDVELG